MQYARYFCGEFDGTVISEEEYRALEASGELYRGDTIEYEPIFDGTIYKDLASSSAAQIAAYGYHYDDDRRKALMAQGLLPHRIAITETFAREVVIYAEDALTAQQRAEDLCRDGKIDLGYDFFQGRSTECRGVAKEIHMDLLETFDVPAPRGTIPTREMIEDWFHRNGHPEPYKGWIDKFFWHPDEDRREQHWEAVMNDYELCDFDRWQHFQDVMGIECSWETFRPIMDSLWAADIEILDLGHDIVIPREKEEDYLLSSTEAKEDIVAYLTAQDAAYFADRGTTKEQVLQDTLLLGLLADEHRKCVNNFGNDREWSCKDACDSDPGISPSQTQENPSLADKIRSASGRTSAPTAKETNTIEKEGR